MKTYLITYDLSKPGQNYGDLTDGIKEIANGWWHHLQSVWIITTRLTAGQIRDRLGRHLDANDKLIVVGLSGAWATKGLNANANQWLQQNVSGRATV